MGDPSTDRRDFFVSFNQADRAWATWIAWVLEEAGHSVFFQDWDFRGSFVEQMHQATLHSARTLVVLSDNYLRSEYARSEAWAALAGDAVGRKDRVVTVKVGPTGDLGLLAQFAHIDLTGETEPDAARLLGERARMSLDLAYRSKPETRPRFPGSARPRQVSDQPRFPIAVNNLPPSNPDFVGREGVLADLRRLLTAGQGPTVLTQAITGLGGIGKTQTARAYAYRHLADYDLIWWLRAETPATLAADYATLAVPLGLDPETADQAKLNAAIRQQLQSRPGWLLIFDNVEDPVLPRAWLPGTGGGHALITSRRADWRGLAKTLSLELMPEAEALQLLTGLADAQTLAPSDLAAAKELTAELGHLPLALAQARAYMDESGKGLAAYLRLFRASRPADFAADAPSPDYPVSYATTWRISIDAAAAASPATRPLLELLAFLAPDPLPIEVLGADPVALPELLRDEHARDDAVAALRRYSLITAEAGAITVHRLVQAVTRDSLDAAATRAYTKIAVRLVDGALPRPPTEHTNWPAYTTLLSHALATTGRCEQSGSGLNVALVVLHETALFHRARAAWIDAELLSQRAIAIGETTLGPDHPNLAIQLNNLANLYRATNRHAEAEPLYQRALRISETALGPDHPDVAIRLNNLAGLFHDTGRHAEAEPLFWRAIAIGDKTLGPDHPNLAIRLNNLGTLYQGTGRHAEAEPLYQRAIAIGEKTLGPDHPDLATSVNNLASLYQATGRYAEAEPLIQRAVAIFEASLPPGHPHIAKARANYASLLTQLGRSSAAPRPPG